VHGAAVPYARSPAHHATAASSGTPHWARAPSPPLLISRGRRGETGHRVSEKNGLSPELLEIASAGADVLSCEKFEFCARCQKKLSSPALASYLELSKVS
jgi:hypothetical protein